jgi:DNA-binding ferritin-like protein
MEKLMAMLKIIYENIQMLHHNVAGNNFFSAHSLMAEYYDKIAEMEDSVVEVGITLGYTEPCMKTAVGMYDCLVEGHAYSEKEVYEYCYNFFEDLIHEFESLKDKVPGDVYSEFESDIYWLRIEAEYKLKKALAQ